MGEKSNAYRNLVGNREGMRWRSAGLILKLILEKHDEVVCTGFIWLRIGTSGGALVNMVMNHRVP
jgi:hypothetical protein